jgi:hypothetical protein
VRTFSALRVVRGDKILSIRSLRAVWFRSGSLVLAALIAAGCGQAPVVTPATPSNPQGSQPVVTEREITAAAQFRERFGLRADRTWVRDVAANPVAQIGIPEFGFPLMPDEFSDLTSRRWDPDLLAQVTRYGEVFPDDFAGAYLNLKGSGVIVAFKKPVERHRVALSNLTPAGSAIEVIEAAWSSKDLLAFVDVVEAERAWFESIGVTFLVDQDVIHNAVHVRFRGAKENEGLIRQHFGHPSWLRAEWTGPLPWEGARADLTIEVQDTKGQPVPRLKCDINPVDPTVPNGGETVFGTNGAGICVLPNIPTTLYQVELYRLVGDDYDPRPVKSFRVELKPGGTSTRVVVPAG